MKIQRVFAQLVRDQRGAVAMTFTFSIFILLGIMGLAIDVSRAYSVAARGQMVLDAASLAAARMLDAPGATDTDVVDSAKAFYIANLASHTELNANFTNLTVTPHRGSQSVAVTVDINVPTYFAGIIGFSNFTFRRESLVIYKTRAIELAMVLDVTGSMADPVSAASTRSKLDEVKIEAKDLVSKVLSQTAGTLNTNRVALAPFSASVNVGTFYGQVADTGAGGVDTCVVERPGVSRTSDAPMSALTRAGVISGGGGNCPAPTIQPLTNDAAALTGVIDGFVADGSTAGHIGMAWGWNLISPNFGAIFTGPHTPAAYADTTTIKAVVIMTDGLFNTAYYNGSGASGAQQVTDSNAAFASLCTNMKANNVTIYTIGYGLAGVGAKALSAADLATARASLLACASDPANFFDVDSQSLLGAAFATINVQLQTLRVAG
jgi:Flp pilus assembly protein TadG